MSEKFILDFDTGSFRKEEKKTKPSSIEELMKQMNELENKHKQEMKVLEDQYKEIKTKALKKEVKATSKMTYTESKSSMMNRVKQFAVTPDTSNKFNLNKFLADAQNDVESFLRKQIKLVKGIKCNYSLHINFRKISSHETMVAGLVLPNEQYTNTFQVTGVITALEEKFQQRIQAYQEQGSNWVMNGIEKFIVDTIIYQPLSGSSYIAFHLSLPIKKLVLMLRMMIMNVSNGLSYQLIILLLKTLKEFPNMKNIKMN